MRKKRKRLHAWALVYMEDPSNPEIAILTKTRQEAYDRIFGPYLRIIHLVEDRMETRRGDEKRSRKIHISRRPNRSTKCSSKR